MRLVDIHLHNFRAFEQRTINFAPHRTVITGENGSGKTTILEAINFMAVGRSFRTSRHGQLVREGTDGFQVLAHLSSSNEELELQATGLPAGAKRMWVNGAQVERYRDILGLLPVVTMTPEDIALVQGPELYRRAFMDRAMGTTDRGYLETLVAYRHVIKQRNAALRQPGARWTDVEIWNAPLAGHATAIWHERQLFAENLAELFSAIWSDYGINTSAELTYGPPTYSGSDEYAEKLITSYDQDTRQGRTTSGPHRDRLNIFLDNRPARSHASMGELKILLATLKLAEARYVQEKLQKAPVVLMDDLFATLDPERAALLLDKLSEDHQVVITTTTLDGLLAVAAQDAGTAIVHCNREDLWQA